MAKSFDPQIINPILSNTVEDIITTRGNVPSTKPFETAAKRIDEYDGRMRIKATDKFDVAVYIAVVNFYLSKAEMDSHKPRGALVLYMDTEVADKMFRAAGLQVPYDEDDESMMALCGNLCQTISDKLKEQIASSGYTALVASPPAVYKNTITEGIAFSKEQEEKQELSFFFLKHKAIVLEWTMAPLPRK